jgi:hypothetical protein
LANATPHPSKFYGVPGGEQRGAVGAGRGREQRIRRADRPAGPVPSGKGLSVEARSGAVEREHAVAERRVDVQVEVAPERPLAAAVRQPFDPGAQFRFDDAGDADLLVRRGLRPSLHRRMGPLPEQL